MKMYYGLQFDRSGTLKPLALLLGMLAGLTSIAPAIPQYARTYNASCVSCHTVAPSLNVRGMEFEARGYRGSPGFESRKVGTIPLAFWITGRHEQQPSRDFSATYLPKVEIISGGPIGDALSYFLEWRVVSLETLSDGTQRDRSGRMEDLFVTWDVSDKLSLDIGQYRAVRQVDVSRRLSVSEPSLFSAGLAGEPSNNPRIQGLRGFSPAGRSPAITVGYHGLQQNSPADGLFSFASVLFPGEFSIPLSSGARTNASFEFNNSPKGVFLESFYRSGYDTIGAHAFIDDNRWLLTGVATKAIGNLHLLGGLGIDERSGTGSRLRSTAQAEYFLPYGAKSTNRTALGFRVEHLTNNNSDPAFIPYLAFTGINELTAFLIQLQFRAQNDNSNSLLLDISYFF